MKNAHVASAGRKINRLFADIETSPNIVLSWRLGYKINLSHDNLLQERAIICIAYKWEHEAKSHCLTWDKNHCDRAMLREFIEVAALADEVVMHNGDKFDLPWIKTRCIKHGIQTFPKYKTIDTLQWARRNFLFNSNRLDYIGQFLGVGGKLKTDFNLWKSVVLERCPKALKSMATYCRRDVEMLQEVYEKLAAHVGHKTHVGVLNGRDKWTCPHCGGDHVKKSMTKITAAGTRQHQMQCKDDGRFYCISEAAYRDYQEAKKKPA